jgi:predicted nucleotidyltransferase
MNKYEEAGNTERLYEEDLSLLQEENFDTKLAGTRLLGRDMAKISDLRTVQIIKGILDAETEELSQHKLATDMIMEAAVAKTRFDEILLQLEKLRQGIVEAREKKIE